MNSAYLLSVGIFGWMFWDITPDLISLAGIICSDRRHCDRVGTAGYILTKKAP